MVRGRNQPKQREAEVAEARPQPHDERVPDGESDKSDDSDSHAEDVDVVTSDAISSDEEDSAGVSDPDEAQDEMPADGPNEEAPVKRGRKPKTQSAPSKDAAVKRQTKPRAARQKEAVEPVEKSVTAKKPARGRPPKSTKALDFEEGNGTEGDLVNAGAKPGASRKKAVGSSETVQSENVISGRPKRTAANAKAGEIDAGRKPRRKRFRREPQEDESHAKKTGTHSKVTSASTSKDDNDHELHQIKTKALPKGRKIEEEVCPQNSEKDLDADPPKKSRGRPRKVVAATTEEPSKPEDAIKMGKTVRSGKVKLAIEHCKS